MKRAWREGAAVVVLAHVSWFGLIVLGSHSGWFMGAIVIMFFLVMNVAGLSAFVAALRAPERKMALAMSMAPLTAVLATISNLVFRVIGVPVDFSGFHGIVGLFMVSLAYGVFVSAVGGGIGVWVSRRQAGKADQPPNNLLPGGAAAGPCSLGDAHRVNSSREA